MQLAQLEPPVEAGHSRLVVLAQAKINRPRQIPRCRQRAARLPRVDVRKPPSIVGGTTVTSMQAGLFYGYVSMVDGIVQRMRAEMPGGDRAACIATGGMADILAGETTAIERVEPDLTLQGLRLIFERANKGS